jgi:hypothetical protein
MEICTSVAIIVGGVPISMDIERLIYDANRCPHDPAYPLNLNRAR